jgi:signal transduction histidine kinase
MRWLPPLVTGHGQWVMPMADRSAGLLEELLLAGVPQAVQIHSLASQLACDPPCVLWCVCAAFFDGNDRPRSVEDVAARFAKDGLRLLRWDGSLTRCDAEPEVGQAETLGDLVAAAVEFAELAAIRAKAGGSRWADDAYFDALLHHAPQWLAATAKEKGEAASGCLPAWVVEVSSKDKPGLDKVGASEVEAARRRAAEVRAEWLTSRGGGAMLPLLTARLARLESLEREFRTVLEREKLEAMYELAAGAGHEINNPLTVISGRAQLFLRDERDPERRRGLALIHSQARRVYEMIAGMTLFARPPALQRGRLNLVKLVGDVLSELASQAASQKTELRLAGETSPVEIEADATQLAVAVKAMCINSLEALGKGGQVEVRVGRNAMECEIVVSDDGPGIQPEERVHLFDPFYCARQAGRGLGVGLSKSWRIVTGHGGRIEVVSQPGQGATFTIRLPIGPSH